MQPEVWAVVQMKPSRWWSSFGACNFAELLPSEGELGNLPYVLIKSYTVILVVLMYFKLVYTPKYNFRLHFSK